MEFRKEMQRLVGAFQNGRLSALHIDMQNQFYLKTGGARATDFVFPVVDRFVSDLRELQVANIWVCYSGEWKKSVFKDFQKN